MKKPIYTLALIFSSFLINAQVGIGTTTPNASAALDISATTKGVLVPRMTSAQKSAIATPATGLLVYQTDGTTGFYYYNGSSWQSFGSAGWSLTGSAGTAPASNKAGTTDAQDFKMVTNNTEAIRFASNGNVGFGTTAPSTKLHVVSPTPATVTFNDGFEDNTVPPFTTGGNSNWLTQNSTVNSGSRAAKSGNIAHSQTSWIETTATIPAQGGQISFAVSTSSEFADDLVFYINGVWQQEWDSATSWTTITYPLTAGAYTFRWAYEKDSSVNALSDTVYLDDVVITSNAGATLEIVDGNQASGKVLMSDATGVATWQLPSSITIADGDWAFPSGTTNSDPIYQTGKVKIGQTSASAYTLHINRGTASGSDMGWGSVEYIEDGVAEIQISDNFSPITDNSANLGSGTLRWKDVWSVNGIVTTSDIRDKEKIEPLKYGLDAIMKLEPVSFKWKQERKDDFIIPEKERETKLGFIAQQILPILPEVIETTEWKEYEENPGVLVKKEMERLGVSYGEIIPVSIKAIQEQQIQIEELKKTNEELEKLISELENKKGAH
jgi:hypothetical protein